MTRQLQGPHSPARYLAEAGKKFPHAWRDVDQARSARMKGDVGWPDWCFLPYVEAAKIIAASTPGEGLDALLAVARDAALLAALAAWRVGQGVYRFDPTLYESLITTEIKGDVPHSVLQGLPEWCVYVELSRMAVMGQPIMGVFAHLEHDARRDHQELRLFLDLGHALLPVVLHLGEWTLKESLDRVVDASAASTIPGARDTVAGMTVVAGPIVSLLLYLCSQHEEIGEPGRRPSAPVPTKTKAGYRHFPPQKVAVWDVGVRIGAALRTAYERTVGTEVSFGTHARPRGHIRRAHWHGFYSGPRLRKDGTVIELKHRKFSLQWLPPVPVNIEGIESLPTVIHPAG